LNAGIIETVSSSFEYPGEKTALRGLLSSGPAIRAMQHAGEEAVRGTILQAIAPFKTETDGYCLNNEFQNMIASIGKDNSRPAKNFPTELKSNMSTDSLPVLTA
jgi:hypothetical protein